jgi:HSP20 family protein
MFGLMPFANTRELFDPFVDFDRRFFANLNSAPARCRVDIIDKGDSYQLNAELPGFDREEIDISLEGNFLTIRAGRSEEKKQEKDSYVYRERRFGSFSRSIDVSGVDKTAINAEYKNGLLRLTLPKIGEQKPQIQKIEIQ